MIELQAPVLTLRLRFISFIRNESVNPLLDVKLVLRL